MDSPQPTAEAIGASVRQAISEVTGLAPAQMTNTASFEDMGIDSLTATEIIVHVEYTYKIRIPPEELATLSLIPDVVRIVQRYLA